MMTFELILRYWPITVTIMGLASTLAVALHQNKEGAKDRTKLHRALFNEDGTLVYMPATEVARALKELEFKIDTLGKSMADDETGYLKISAHQKLCRISALEISNAIKQTFEQREANIISTVNKGLEAHQKAIIAAIKGKG